MLKAKRVKVWVEEPGSVKVDLYEVPPTVWKRIAKLLEGYECKPKKNTKAT